MSNIVILYSTIMIILCYIGMNGMCKRMSEEGQDSQQPTGGTMSACVWRQRKEVGEEKGWQG